MMHNGLRWCSAIGGVLVSLCTPLLGCYDYTVIHPTTEPDGLYWELRTDHRAVLLSKTPPYNTLQLTATPYNLNGDPLALDTLRVSPVVWESSDTTAVKVSQTGVISAEKVTTRVNVYATMAVGKLTRRDTIWVGVTATAPSALDSLVVFDPTATNIVAAGGTLALAARARLENGALVTGVPVSYRVSNRWLADFKGSLGVLSGIVPLDSVYVSATTTVYGVTRRDSLRIYTGYPQRFFVTVFALDAVVSKARKVEYVPRFIDQGSAPGSMLVWHNASGFPPKNAVGYPPGGMLVDIIFDRPEFAEAPMGEPPFNQSGNILQLPYDTTGSSRVALRKFTQPGEHWYTVEPLGVRGKVTIGER